MHVDVRIIVVSDGMSCRAQMVQGGFMTIWDRLAQKLPNVHKGVNISKVDRRKDDPKKSILIT